MNQIQAPPYQQPSFSHAHGIYPQQQPHFAVPHSVPAPHHSHPQSSQSQSQPHHPLSSSRSQSPLVSPSTQDPRALATPPSPSLASPSSQQQHHHHQFQYPVSHQTQHLYHASQPSPGNGSVSSAGGRTGAHQASQQAQSAQSGDITPRTATFPPPSASTFAPSSSSQQTVPQQQPQHPGIASPQKYPMAAPPLPPSVHRQQSPHSGSNAAVSQPSSPRSTANQALEKERVGLLLEINLVLLEEMNTLISQGKGGAVNQQQAALMRSQGLPDKTAADEYIQTFFRLQANLAYLYSQPDMQALNPQKQSQPQQGNKGPTHPPHFMHSPPHMPSLEDKYGALRKLFPGWMGKDAATSSNATAGDGNSGV